MLLLLYSKDLVSDDDDDSQNYELTPLKKLILVLNSSVIYMKCVYALVQLLSASI